MITELQIEGFKSFGSPEETVELGPLNFVVGANASGKTNLLSALRFLQNAVIHDVSYAVSEMGGNAEVRNKRLRQRQELKPVRLSLRLEKEFELSLPGDSDQQKDSNVVRSFEYQLVLDLRSEDTAPNIEAESLTAQFLRDGKTNTMGLERSGTTLVVTDPTTEYGKKRTLAVPEQEPTRLALVGVGFFSLPATILREEIRGWRFHNFIPSVARQPYREEPDATLGPAGEKLAAILHRMSEEDRASISQELRAIVPGLRGIKTTKLPIEDTLAFQIVEDKLRAAINPASVSDGTVRLLALLVVTTRSVQDSPLITIEEPENGVHPHLAEYLVEILRSGSERSQVIVTTHCPALLDYLEPQEVILCDKKDGFTKPPEGIERGRHRPVPRAFQPWRAVVPRCGRGGPMRIGVGVEGPSDRTFWHEVLHKRFGGIQFDVRTMGSKETLIRQTPRLLEAFRSLQYTAGFILVDRERDPCFPAVLERFDEAIRGEARSPVNDRYLFVCVAIRGLESWFLADPFSINGLMPGANYIAPRETARVNPKRKLSDLWKKEKTSRSLLFSPEMGDDCDGVRPAGSRQPGHGSASNRHCGSESLRSDEWGHRELRHLVPLGLQTVPAGVRRNHSVWSTSWQGG